MSMSMIIANPRLCDVNNNNTLNSIRSIYVNSAGREFGVVLPFKKIT